LPEWWIEQGIGEIRAALVDDGTIVEARIELEGLAPSGSVVSGTLTDKGRNGRNAVARDDSGREYLLPRGAESVTEGAKLRIQVTREQIPGLEPWKRAIGRISSDEPRGAEALAGRPLPFPAAEDALAGAGWDDLVDEARAGIVRFAGGELRISVTPAMTLIDVDGYLSADELAITGAGEAAKAIRRLHIGGSIGIDLPTVPSRADRLRAVAALDAVLPQPFERTAVNGFGFLQIVRRRERRSLPELLQWDETGGAARALLRRAERDPGVGPRELVAAPAVIARLRERPDWLEAVARRTGAPVALQEDPRFTTWQAHVHVRPS
jgi:hypothetical protein